MKNKIIVGLISLSLVILVIIVIISQVPKTIELTTMEKAYNIVQFSEREIIEIPIHINRLDTYLVDTTNISSVKISDETNSLAFEIDKIDYTNEKLSLKNKEYYNYIFKLIPTISLENDFSLEMKNANLEINYLQGVDLNIKIGTLSYYYYKGVNDDLSLKSLKGLINTYEDKALVGVSIGLKNNSKNKIFLKNIIPLDVSVIASLDELVFNKDFKQGEDISQFLGYNYNLYAISQVSNVNIPIDQEVDLFLPLKYSQDIFLNKLGFLIEYESNGENQYLCIDDFLFFETAFYSPNKINKLKFYTYENY